MARKKSTNKMTTTEMLQSIRQEIVETQEHLKQLREKEKQIIEQKRQEDLDSLIETLNMTGISISDAQELIKNAAKANSTQDDQSSKTA